LDCASATTEALFNGPDKLLVMNDEVWLPAAVSRLGDGFSAAWNEAIRRIDGLIANGENAEMIIIEEAWKTYPPAPFPALGVRLVLPDSNAVNAAANAVVQNYIKSEFEPKLAAVREQIRGNPGASLYNQLGNLYLRSGMMPQAKTAYEQAAGMGLAGAMINRGNAALHENDIAAAERWFRQALAKDPRNKSALRGIELVEVRK
jgi:tetratricopeptide (TPR) repeat protein